MKNTAAAKTTLSTAVSIARTPHAQTPYFLYSLNYFSSVVSAVFHVRTTSSLMTFMSGASADFLMRQYSSGATLMKASLSRCQLCCWRYSTTSLRLQTVASTRPLRAPMMTFFWMVVTSPFLGWVLIW